MSGATAWRATLDALLVDIEAAEAGAAAGDLVALPAFVPAPDLGPLPDAFVAEARALAARLDAVVSDLSSRRRPDARVINHRPAPRATSHFEVRA